MRDVDIEIDKDNFTSMILKREDIGIDILSNMPAEDYIEDLAGLCEYLSADCPSLLNKRIYKATACGASISVYCKEEDPGTVHCGDECGWSSLDAHLEAQDPLVITPYGFTIQTIVEGIDPTVDGPLMIFPVLKIEVEEWVAEMESEAKYLWEEGNGETYRCNSCGLEDNQYHLELAKDLSDRLDPGGPYTDRECPLCGALCYPIEEEC